MPVDIQSADRLEEIIHGATTWPVWSADRAGGLSTGTYAQAGQYGASLREVDLWASLRESDKGALKQLMGWPQDREYRIDPLPERIGEAFSDLLYSEDPEFIAPNTGDQKKLEELTDSNFMPEQLRRWVDQCVTEGEIWWRVYVDLDQSEWPIIDAHSRLDVIPLFYGRKIPAVAFISNILTQEIHFEKQVQIKVWRHIEIHSEGYVRNLLFSGAVGSIGTQVKLGSDPLGETEGLPEEWEHELPMKLAGRVPNKLGRDWRLGISQLKGVKDLILDLNESRTIMAENARNTAKARMVISADQLDEFGQFDAGKDVVIRETQDESLDEKAQKSFTVLEYTFQAAQLLSHINDLVTTILTRCGLAEQFVQGGRGGEGQAFTGTALRTRLIPTTLAAGGKGKFWDRSVPDMLKALAAVANIPEERGGCGQTFTDPEGVFQQKRGNILPQDQNEETQRHVMAVQGEVESIYNAVREMHPEWEDEEIQEEIKRIKKDHEPPKPVVQVVDPRTGNGNEEDGKHDENEPPGAKKGVADAPAKPGEQSSDLRDTTSPRKGTRKGTKGETPGKKPARVTAGASK